MQFTLKLKDREVPLRLPDLFDRRKLVEAYSANREDADAKLCVFGAAIRLAWPADQVAPPWQPGGRVSSGDLVRLGREALELLDAVAEFDSDLIDAGDQVLAECFKRLRPDPEAVKARAGFSEPSPTSPGDSSSPASGGETPSSSGG